MKVFLNNTVNERCFQCGLIRKPYRSYIPGYYIQNCFIPFRHHFCEDCWTNSNVKFTMESYIKGMERCGSLLVIK